MGGPFIVLYCEKQKVGRYGGSSINNYATTLGCTTRCGAASLSSRHTPGVTMNFTWRVLELLGTIYE
jgi:hypothetical protein